MNFKEFTTWAKTEVRNYIPKELQDKPLIIHPVNKLGESYTALSIKPENGISHTSVCLEDFYKLYNPDEEEKLLQQMAESLCYKDYVNPNITIMETYEKIKPNLFIRLSNAKWNRELLTKVPYTPFLDLAITYHVRFNYINDQLASTMITNQLMEAYKIDKAQLHKDAIQNSQRLFPLKTQKVAAMLEDYYPKELNKDSNLLLVTNNHNLNGAAVIVYPDTLNHIYNTVHEDYYIIPSSIHEVLIKPAHSISTMQGLQYFESTIQEVNQRFVNPSEVLSDHLYYYDGKKGELKLTSVMN